MPLNFSMGSSAFFRAPSLPACRARNGSFVLGSCRSRSLGRNDTLAFLHLIEAVGRKIGERFHLPVGPSDFGLVDALVSTEPKVNTKIVLRKIAASADQFTGLNEVPGSCSYPRVQSEAITPRTFQLETDPMIRRPALRLQNHRFTLQSFNDDFHAAIVEEITANHSPADSWNLDRRPNEFTDVLERAVPLILEEQHGFQVLRANLYGVDLRINVSASQEYVRPAIVLPIDKSVAPTDIRGG